MLNSRQNDRRTTGWRLDRRWIMCAVVFATLGFRSPSSARFAAPQIMLFEGAALHHRVALPSIAENMDVLERATPAALLDAHAKRSRPRLDVWLYWGPTWTAVAVDSTAVLRLSTKVADQHAYFYPEHRGQPARLEIESARGAPPSATLLQAPALAILARRGVPVKL